MSLRSFISRLFYPVTWLWNTAVWLWSTALGTTKELILRAVLTVVLFFGYLIASMMLYTILRHIMVPPKTHMIPVHLYFNPQCTISGGAQSNTRTHPSSSSSVHDPEPVPLFTQEAKHYYSQDQPVGMPACFYPYSEFFLAGGSRLLSPGQLYTVTLEIELPESPSNEMLGMFMVNTSLYSNSRAQLATSARHVMLHYRSPLLQTLSTFFYSLPLLLGWSEQRQHLSVTMMDYQEPFAVGAVYARVTVLSHHVQLYRVTLKLDANFTGLAYYLYHWPLSMAVIVVLSAFISMSTVTVLMWLRKLSRRFNNRQQEAQQQQQQQPGALQQQHQRRRRPPQPADGTDQRGRREGGEHHQRRPQVEELSSASGSSVGRGEQPNTSDTQDTESVISSVSELTTTTDTGELSELEASLYNLRRQVEDGLPRDNWMRNDQAAACDEEEDETRMRQRQAH